MKLTPFFAISCLVLVAGCNKTATSSSAVTGSKSTGGKSGAGAPGARMGISKLTKLTIKDTKLGDGIVQGIKIGNMKPVQPGDTVSIQYTGKLQDGTMFDTNLPGTKLSGQPNAHDHPLTFIVGRQRVVPGLDQGVVGMVVGGEREIGIPPSLGYGSNDLKVIPPNSDLLFHVKLLDVVKPGEETYFDKKDLAAGSGSPIGKGDTVQLEYTVKLVDGTVVDTNVGKDPFQFTIGEVPPRVITGMEQGVIGMKKGAARILRIPPAIAYGTKKVEKIPPDSTLIVQVKILDII